MSDEEIRARAQEVVNGLDMLDPAAAPIAGAAVLIMAELAVCLSGINRNIGRIADAVEREAVERSGTDRRDVRESYR